MFNRRKYVEVYSTLKMEDFFRAKNFLSENRIIFKDSSTYYQNRLASNNVRGNNIILSRQGVAKDLFSLSVGKEDEEKARRVLRGISG